MICDPNINILAALASTLEPDYTTAEGDWAQSPFGWIRRQSSIWIRGQIGEKLVSGWLATRGFNVTRSLHTDADRIVENKRIEIKFAMLGKKRTFTFNQFRKQQYDAALCIGICPSDARCWLLPRDAVTKQWGIKNGIRVQHNPQDPNANTGILTTSFMKPKPWLVPFGGTLSEGMEQLSALTGYYPEPI